MYGDVPYKVKDKIQMAVCIVMWINESYIIHFPPPGDVE